MVWATLVVACGGKPGIEFDGESSVGGATHNSGISNAGTGAGLNFNTGGASQAGAGTEEPSICGNGKVETKELCDDGNTADGDGCSPDCKVQDPHYRCTAGAACVKWVNCGNGMLEGDEICDDGNANSNDGCRGDCGAVEAGYACARPGKPCVTLPKCGNGSRERGEGCDDGEAVPDDGDGCSATCQTEPGFICLTPGQPCTKLVCGDGNRTPDEQCDDANTASGDGCSPTCQVESGWRCSSLGCSAICGDGLVLPNEQCDDNNHNSGDGCSASCLTEPYFNCSGQPSVCNSTIVCGNNVREPGEKCDPPGVDGCEEGCKSFLSDYWKGTTECGNSIIELGETCDPPAVGSGCSATCVAEAGWICPRPGSCVRVPVCGDGQVNFNTGEACDDGNATPNDGCTSCAIDTGWDCDGLKPSTCARQVCGDGVLASNEECDDTNSAPGDGCSSDCKLESVYWVCPRAGQKCRPRCGDGVMVGIEECDDKNLNNDDGCNAACRIESGYACTVATVGTPSTCTPAVCGNGKVEPGENCDKGDKTAGDGCSPTCQFEPTVTVGPNPVVNIFCGDGMITGDEKCDDGNKIDGDGCSSTCAIETGFLCDPKLELPTSVLFQVTYRDFKARASSGGHPDFQWAKDASVLDLVGPVCKTSNAATCGRLDNDGKPTLNTSSSYTDVINSADSFRLWYRDSNTTAPILRDANTSADVAIAVVPKTLELAQSSTGSKDYVSTNNSTSFFPLGNAEGLGYENGQFKDDSSTARNFHFTSELRYFFQYSGGETLLFSGDDDVWVFINGRLAVDIGGRHGVRHGRVVLGDDGDPSGTDSDCSVHEGTSAPAVTCTQYTSAESTDTTDKRFNLTKGGVYEIVLFHAERYTTQSNFKLTLSGFLAPRSYCHPDCGDGVVAGTEECDDGKANNTGSYGGCTASCKFAPYCGDGTTNGPEKCDNGRNTTTYLAGPRTTECAPGCVLPPTCGDNTVQGSEQCDNGAANNDSSYGLTSCTTKCLFGGYCGDGIKNGDEVCDAGAKNGSSYGEGSCGYDCKSGPYYCGDGVRNGQEECDEGPTGGANCGADCKVKPFCGDGVTSANEVCDYGKFASNLYGSCTAECVWSAICGDHVINAGYEECDDGTANNTGAYGGCTATCNLGPRCGDAVQQADKGEQCDNGYNLDTYEYMSGACGRNCQRPPYCGDGAVASGYELCDNGAANDDTTYLGCTTHCEWGPYCGDGKIDPQGGEVCDNGRNNVIWGNNASACGYDCKPAPYCGDGERNGPEQCDLGTAKNTGAYGTCNPDCTLGPRCGDHVIQAPEQCDDGPTGSFDCTADCDLRTGIII